MTDEPADRHVGMYVRLRVRVCTYFGAVPTRPSIHHTNGDHLDA